MKASSTRGTSSTCLPRSSPPPSRDRRALRQPGQGLKAQATLAPVDLHPTASTGKLVDPLAATRRLMLELEQRRVSNSEEASGVDDQVGALELLLHLKSRVSIVIRGLKYA